MSGIHFEHHNTSLKIHLGSIALAAIGVGLWLSKRPSTMELKPGEEMPPFIPAVEDLRPHWEIVRKQVEHEDGLINHRITWNIQASAMLLAAFAGGIWLRSENTADLKGPPFTPEGSVVYVLLALLTIFGFVISYVTLRSVTMANCQIDLLNKWWVDLQAPALGGYPRLLGKAAPSFLDRHLGKGYVVPFCFCALWLILALAQLGQPLLLKPVPSSPPAKSQAGAANSPQPQTP